MMVRLRSARLGDFSRYGQKVSHEWKRKPPKKKYFKTFKNYCSELLKDSSVTGVSSIVKSKGCCRKVSKLLILSFGVAGFLLQTHEFLKLFWEFSTVASMNNMASMKKPAITICDENLIRRRYLCENVPDACISYTDDEMQSFCILYGPYCVDKNDIYARAPASVLETYNDEFFDLNFTKTSGFLIEESILQCEWLSNEENNTKTSNSNECGKPEFIRGMNAEKLPGACYSLKTSVGFEAETLNRDAVLKMTLKWRSSDLINVAPELLSLAKPAGRYYSISVHYPAQLSNAFMEGFRVQERKNYKVQVTQIDQIRMPPPYATECHDYVRDWKQNGGKGPLNRQDCQALCEIELKFEAYGCVPRDLDFPHYKKLCITFQPFDHILNAKIQKCIRECRDACLETKYVTDSEVAGEIAAETATKRYGTPSIVTIEVYFDTLKSKISIYKPKYESIELFSYIGGYLGMWLGWSLVALFDFLEIIFNICKYPFIIKKKQRKNTPVIPFRLDRYY